VVVVDYFVALNRPGAVQSSTVGRSRGALSLPQAWEIAR
jgi:hypothetical protein